MGKKLEHAISVLNGIVGDRLARTGNGLATTLQLVHCGVGLACDRDALTRAHPTATAKVVVLVHGLMSTETIWEMATGGDYGSMLAADLGYTPLYVRYNTGLAIADNGASLAALLAALVATYPVPIDELLLLGYSMGGLVVRSACHVASEQGLGWLSKVRRSIYVGTPHRGAPLERVGRTVSGLLRALNDPYTVLIADLGDLRSAGVKDLGDADLRHEDRDRAAGIGLRDPHHPVPLLDGIQHYLIAGAVSDAPLLRALFGDGIVPVASATNRYAAAPGAPLPPDHVAILSGVSHLDIPRHPAVYERIRAWLAPDAGKETT